jgi:hypothetical protein
LSKLVDGSRQPLDLGMRRDDDFQANSSSNIIPAHAGIQRRSMFFR